MMSMATCTQNSNESGAVPRDRVLQDSTRMTRSKASAHADTPKPIGSIARYPIVRITPAEPVKRLGTGWHWWFSETVRVPIGSKVEFRFPGPAHLLALYNEGVRRDGETSIDGLDSSRLRNFTHKLTFVPAGCAYREWHETGASTRVTFLYLDPAALQRSDGDQDGFLPR